MLPKYNKSILLLKVYILRCRRNLIILIWQTHRNAGLILKLELQFPVTHFTMTPFAAFLLNCCLQKYCKNTAFLIKQTTDNQRDRATCSHPYSKQSLFFSIAVCNNEMLSISFKGLYNNKIWLISFKTLWPKIRLANTPSSDHTACPGCIMTCLYGYLVINKIKRSVIET